MGDLHISRFTARYRVSGAEPLRRARGVGQALLEEALETALAPFDRDDQLILVRRLAPAVELHPGQTEQQAAHAWGEAVAQALERLLRGGSPRDLLRFPHRLAAETAFAADMVAGNGLRDWGWRQLGLLPREGATAPAERFAALLRLLARAPETIVPLLRGLAARGLIAPFCARLDAPLAEALVRAVLRAAGGSGEAAFPAADSPPPPAAALPAPADPAGAALLALLGAEPAGERGRWLARLAVLLAEPAAARGPAAALEGRAQGWLAAAAMEAAAEVTGAAPRARAEADRGPAAPETGAAPGRTAHGKTEPPPPAAPHPQSPRPDGEAAAPPPTAAGEPHAAPPGDPLPEPSPVSGYTAFGGLLFLLPRLAEWGVLEALEDPEVWPGTPLPRALQALAHTLLPIAPRDPARLAFCGLPPDREPPGGEPPAEGVQRAVLEACRGRIVAALAERLPAWAGPGIVEQVARREAVIQADPGWFEVRLRLTEVSVDLRRAALDLDPGYIPWLGIVLRYLYV